jgi:hypothetical protein
MIEHRRDSSSLRYFLDFFFAVFPAALEAVALAGFFFVIPFFATAFFAEAAFLDAAVFVAVPFLPPNALSQFSQNSGVVPVRTIGPPILTAPVKKNEPLILIPRNAGQSRQIENVNETPGSCWRAR